MPRGGDIQGMLILRNYPLHSFSPDVAGALPSLGHARLSPFSEGSEAAVPVAVPLRELPTWRRPVPARGREKQTGQVAYAQSRMNRMNGKRYGAADVPDALTNGFRPRKRAVKVQTRLDS